MSLPVVREKVQSHVELNGMSPRHVYDKLKKDFLQDKRYVPATPSDCQLSVRPCRIGLNEWVMFPKRVNLATYPLFP